MNKTFRRFAEGQQLVFRTTATRSAKADARERERRRHDLHEVPAGNRIGQLAGVLRELALQELLELRSVRELIQTAPIMTTRGWRCVRRGNGFHR